MHNPEIVAPGGSRSKAHVAARYGADAIYIGVPFTSLRMRQNDITNFKLLQTTIEDIHALGKRAYLTMNIFPRNHDLKVFESVLDRLVDVQPDAIIFSDPGTFRLIRNYFPNIRLHLSTQANTLNTEAIKFWQDLGVTRVILARELTIKEIAQIKEQIPTIELEAFVHGAMCIAYSGRCFMGEYFSGRDSNKGECSHVCRYKFKVHLEEERRPGKMLEFGEDEDGTYLLSSKDLCTVERLAELMPYLDGLKIEGRSKSELYVGATTLAYSHVRDALIAGEPLQEDIKNLVYQIPHRQYRDGFFFQGLRAMPDGPADDSLEPSTQPDDIQGSSLESPGPIANREYCGYVTPPSDIQEANGYVPFIPKQKLHIGDILGVLSPQGISESVIIGLRDQEGRPVDYVENNMKNCFLQTEHALQGRELLRRPMSSPRSSNT